jgi:hypothetical protein
VVWNEEDSTEGVVECLVGVEEECAEVRLRGRYQGSCVVGWAMSSKSCRKKDGRQVRVRAHMRTGVARAWAVLSC